jgi:hypothetical protein
MRIAIFGSWRVDGEFFSHRGSQTEFEDACQEIGKQLAREGQQVLVDSESKYTADYHVVKGIVDVSGDDQHDYPLIEVYTDVKRKCPFETYALRFPDLFRFHPQKLSREAAYLFSVRESDAIFVIGGHKNAYIAGIASIVARKQLVPIASFGGAATQLFNDLNNLGEIENTLDFNKLNGPWTAVVSKAAFRFAGIIKSRPKIFLGYCSKARSTANDLILYLEHELKVSVQNYAMDFLVGRTILEEIERACHECDIGVFLFTKDDPLEGKDKNQAAPRDNVVFEAGYFVHAKGKERALIIREEGAKMPADLGGSIYISLKDRNDISTIQTQLRQALKAGL